MQRTAPRQHEMEVDMPKKKHLPGDIPGFTHRLNAAKDAKGVTDLDIALVCDRDRKAVVHWRNGQTVPDAVSVRQMCLLFGVSADWLLGLDDAKPDDIWNISAFS